MVVVRLMVTGGVILAMTCFGFPFSCADAGFDFHVDLLGLVLRFGLSADTMSASMDESYRGHARRKPSELRDLRALKGAKWAYRKARRAGTLV